MAKIPKNPSDIFDEFSTDVKNIFTDDLVSIILYGSAARGEYTYKKSDINFLIILTDQGISNLRKCLSLIPKWGKRNVATPLFLTKNYIEESLDSFPIEFLGMRMHYQLIYGEDVLQAVGVEEEDLRLACEREMKGKLLHLREGFLNAANNTRNMKSLISQSIAAFTTIFSAILSLKAVDLPGKRRELFSKMADEFDLDKKVFDDLMNVRENNVKFSKMDLINLMEQYIREIEKLTDMVDKF